ncbi:MAG: hypothetical protein WCK09_20310, partial [Bacteroidota bacterium]
SLLAQDLGIRFDIVVFHYPLFELREFITCPAEKTYKCTTIPQIMNLAGHAGEKAFLRQRERSG